MLRVGLPDIFIPTVNIGQRALTELQRHHRWISPFYAKTNHNQTKVLGILLLAVSILTAFFTISMVYSFSDPVDDVCFQLETHNRCLVALSPFSTFDRMCSWDEGICKLRMPQDAVGGVVIAGLLAYLLYIPLYYLLKMLLVDFVFKHTKKVVNSLASFVKDSSSISITSITQEHFQLLKSMLFKYRMTFSSNEDRENFDACWNLDADVNDDIVFHATGYPTERLIVEEMLWTNINSLAMHPSHSYRAESDDFERTLTNVLFRDFLSLNEATILVTQKLTRNKLLHPKTVTT